MQPFPLSQLGAMADKQQLACVTGTIVKIWNPKTGTTGKGDPWSIQNAVLQGTCGTQVGLWLKDRAPIPLEAKGRVVTIQSHTGDKGLSGLYVFDDTYNDKTERKIKVTPTGIITWGAEGMPPGAQAAAAQQPHQASQQAAQQGDWPTEAEIAAKAAAEGRQSHPEHQEPPPQQKTQRDAPDSLKEARRTIMQIANLHLLCASAVAKYEATEYKARTGAVMSESQIQGSTASIFIEACKNGMVRNMPTGRLPEDV